MATTTKWSGAYTSLGTLLSNTELASVANNANSTIGTAYDNTSGLYTVGAAKLILGTMTAPTAGFPIYLYYTTALDGTNYTTLDNNSCGLLGVFSCRNATTATLEIDSFRLPAVKFKPFIRNSSAQAFGASGNSCELFGVNFQNV